MKSTVLGLVTSAAMAFGLLTLEAPPAAAEPVRYEAAYVFGDSLSDPGNFFALTEALTGTGQPGFPYFEGRVSNGPVWADYLEADFARAGLPFRNYAFAFARVVTPTPAAPGLPASDLPINLTDQLGRFALDAPTGVPARSVAMVWLGANDSFNIISNTLTQIGGGADAGLATLAAIGAAQAVAQQLLDSLSVLAPAGIRDLVLFNLPDLGQIPRFFGTPAQMLASTVSGAFNAELAAGTVAGVNLRRFDVAALFDELVATPTNFGVRSLEACLVDATLCLDPNDRAFFDQEHPSAPVHARLGSEVRALVAPIPLPAGVWMLLAGLVALGAVRRQARA